MPSAIMVFTPKGILHWSVLVNSVSKTQHTKIWSNLFHSIWNPDNHADITGYIALRDHVIQRRSIDLAHYAVW